MKLERIARGLASRPARLVLFLALLLPPWSFVGRGYGRGVAALAELLATVAGTGATLRIGSAEDGAPAAGAWRLPLHAEDPVTGQYVGTLLDLRRSTYIATAVFLALVLATPLRLRRKVGLAFAGLAFLQTLALLPVLSFFSGKLPVRLFDLGPTARGLIDLGYHALVAPPGMAYALPGLLWLCGVWALEPGCLTASARTRYSRA